VSQGKNSIRKTLSIQHMSLKNELIIGYVTLAGDLDFFDAHWADDIARRSLASLESLGLRVISTDRLVTSKDDAADAARLFRREEVDIMVLQNGTFALGDLAVDLAQKLQVPIVLWAVPEPSLGNRSQLRSNSLCGAMMNASALKKTGRNYQFFYGLPEDQNFKRVFKRYAKVLETIKRLGNTCIGLVGYRVPGFYGSTFNELELRRVFGISVHHVDLTQVEQEAKTLPETEARRVALQIQNAVRSISVAKPDEHFENLARMYLSFVTISKKFGLNAFAIKCWPEFDSVFGCAACSTLGKLTEEGLISACEADMEGAVTMLIQYYLTGEVPFFSDLVSVDQDRNTALLWHCGNAPVSLASDRQQTRLEQDYLKGGALQFSLKPGPATLARLGNMKGKYRMLIGGVEAIEPPPEPVLKGTSIEIRVGHDVGKVLNTIVRSGFEHHFSLAYGNIVDELTTICEILGIEPVLI